jgi:two-component system, NarL family, nitrate/nitrite response regulator NarL
VIDRQETSRPEARHTTPLRVVLADDESLFRASLRQLLSSPPAVIKDVYGIDVGPGFDVIGEAGTGEDTVNVVRTRKPDLLIVDLSMPRMNGLEAVRELGRGSDAVPAILLAGSMDRRELLLAVQLGVRGLVLKHSPTECLFQAIVCVARGGSWVAPTLVTDLLDTVRPLLGPSRSDAPGGWNLTARERQVLDMVGSGCANKEIARRFGVSEETVKHHLTSLFAKVGASNRLELALAASRSCGARL